MPWPEYVPAPPCEVCRRTHRGRRCKPKDERTMTLTVTVPGYVLRTLRERYPRYERSAYVSKVLARDLELDQEAAQ